MEPDFDTLMAHLHVTPPLATSALMACHPPPALARHARTLPAQLVLLAAHSAAYIGWSRFCVAMNGGHWPYPFQAGLGVWGHAALDGGVLAAAVGMATAAHRGVRRKVRRYAATGVGGEGGRGGGSCPPFLRALGLRLSVAVAVCLASAMVWAGCWRLSVASFFLLPSALGLFFFFTGVYGNNRH